jgi:hypothetical protein
MGAVLKLDAGLAIAGELSGAGWNLPATLTHDEWVAAGAALSKIEQSKQWWLGDWWNAGKWGDGPEACEQIGVEYQTARNCAAVSGAFTLSRRRDNLTFTHHAETCSIDDEATRERFLDWCLDGDKPRSTRELREAIRQYLDEQGWTDDERDRREQVKNGRTIVVNQKTDERLIRWAQFEGKLTRIDRTTDWGNPFELPADGTRDEVCDNYAVYLGMKPSLTKRIKELRGRVLACWCYPQRCHGNHLADLANE